MLTAAAVFLSFAVFLFLFPVERLPLPSLRVVVADLEEQARQADLEVNLTPYALLRVAAAVLAAVFAVILSLTSGPFTGAAALLLGLGVFRFTRGAVRKLEEKRRKEIEAEFPLFVSQVLVLSRAADLLRALEAAGRSLSGELGRQVRKLRQEMDFLPVKTALRRFARRVKYPPVESFVSVLLFGITTGADVTEVLESFGKRAYEARVNELKRRVKAQPVWLSFLPVGLGLFIILVLVYPLFTDIVTRLRF